MLKARSKTLIAIIALVLAFPAHAHGPGDLTPYIIALPVTSVLSLLIVSPLLWYAVKQSFKVIIKVILILIALAVAALIAILSFECIAEQVYSIMQKNL